MYEEDEEEEEEALGEWTDEEVDVEEEEDGEGEVGSALVLGDWLSSSTGADRRNTAEEWAPISVWTSGFVSSCSRKSAALEPLGLSSTFPLVP